MRTDEEIGGRKYRIGDRCLESRIGLLERRLLGFQKRKILWQGRVLLWILADRAEESLGRQIVFFDEHAQAKSSLVEVVGFQERGTVATCRDASGGTDEILHVLVHESGLGGFRHDVAGERLLLIPPGIRYSEYAEQSYAQDASPVGLGASERARLSSEKTWVFTKSRVTVDEIQDHVISLINAVTHGPEEGGAQ